MILPADIATYEIAGRQLIVLSILVLYFGEFLTHRINFLQKNNIPASVTGVYGGSDSHINLSVSSVKKSAA